MQSSPITRNITTRNIASPNGNDVTPNSTVSLNLGGYFPTTTIQITGTYTGALNIQVQLDDNNWVTLTGAQTITNVVTGAQSGTIASAATGLFQVGTGGLLGVRVTALGAMTGTAVVTLLAGAGASIVAVDAPVQIAAGTNTIGTVATPAGTPISVTSAATTNASVQKASAGNLFEVSVSNPTATPAYVKLYNKASAPTVGTDIPVLTIVAPATSAAQIPTAINLTFSQIGKRFSTGIAMAITAGPLATDTAAAVAGVQVHGTYI